MQRIEKVRTRVLIRTLAVPASDDPDWVTTQDEAAVRAQGAAVFPAPAKSRVLLWGEFVDAAGARVTSGRGSFDLQPIRVQGSVVLDAPVITGARAYEPYVLDHVQSASALAPRVLNVLEPAGAVSLRFYAEALR